MESLCKSTPFDHKWNGLSGKPRFALVHATLAFSHRSAIIALKRRYSQPLADLEKISAVHISLLDYLE